MQEAEEMQSMFQEDPPEEGMATHSSITAWRIFMDRRAWQAAIHRVANSQTRLKQLSPHSHVNMHATSSLAIYLSMDTKIASVS